MLQYAKDICYSMSDIRYSMSKTYVIVCQSHMLQFIKDICYSMPKPYVTICQRHVTIYQGKCYGMLKTYIIVFL